MDWTGLLLAITAGLLVWFGFRMFKRNPAAFNKENLSKSLSTMGVLTLMIIGVVALCVFMLKQ